MSQDFLHQPHDKLFKAAFSQPETAVAAFRAYLPKRLLRHLDLSHPELLSGTHIDADFQLLESDLLFRFRQIKRDVFVYVLFEHQAQEDFWMALRLYHYLCRIWMKHHRDHPKARQLPLIVPLVLAQQPGPWRAPTCFADLFALSDEQKGDFAEIIPNFTYYLLPLAEIPFEKIVGTPFGIVALRVLKAYPREELLGREVWDEALLQQLSSEDRCLVLHYIFALGDLDEEQFTQKITQLTGTEVRHDVMTLAERFIQKGKKEGERAGEKRGEKMGEQRGEEKGLRKGALVGRIQLLQSLLGQPETPASTLEQQSLADLQVLHDELSKTARLPQHS